MDKGASSKNISFREHLKDELIKQVSLCKPVYKGKEFSQNVDIACIQFAFDNFELINLLK